MRILVIAAGKKAYKCKYIYDGHYYNLPTYLLKAWDAGCHANIYSIFNVTE